MKSELTKRETDMREMTETYEQLKASYEASVRLGDELKTRLEKLQSQFLELDEKRRGDERELAQLRHSASASPTNSCYEEAASSHSTSDLFGGKQNVENKASQTTTSFSSGTFFFIFKVS